MQDIYRYVQDGIDENGPGLRPLRVDRRAAEVHAPPGNRPASACRPAPSANASCWRIRRESPVPRHRGFHRRYDPRGRSGDALFPAADFAARGPAGYRSATPASLRRRARRTCSRTTASWPGRWTTPPRCWPSCSRISANFDLIFEQADTTLTVGKLAAVSVILGLAGFAVAVAMKSPVAMVPLAGARRRLAAHVLAPLAAQEAAEGLQHAASRRLGNDGAGLAGRAKPGLRLQRRGGAR